MSVILTKSASCLSKQDVKKELLKIDELEQDIEGSICQCVYTNPVLTNPCNHLYGEACIKQWCTKINEGPKCKVTIKSTVKKPELEPLFDLYLKMIDQEKSKLKQIDKLVQEREKMQEKINDILDKNIVEAPKRPSTAHPKSRKEVEVPLQKKYSPRLKSEHKEEEDYINCKIGKRRPLSKPLKDCKNIEFSPISLSGNTYAQTLLKIYMESNNLTLDIIYNQVLNSLEGIDISKLYPDSKTNPLKPTDSACHEGLFNFVEEGISYYCAQNSFAINPASNPNCEAGAFGYQQYDENHAMLFNHFIAKY